MQNPHSTKNNIPFSNLELTTEFKEAYKIMNEGSDSVFITGESWSW